MYEVLDETAAQAVLLLRAGAPSISGIPTNTHPLLVFLVLNQNNGVTDCTGTTTQERWS